MHDQRADRPDNGDQAAGGPPGIVHPHERRHEVQARPIPADQAILETASAAQAAAADARQLLGELLGLERARARPPRVAWKMLSEATRPWQNVEGIAGPPTRSFALLNPSASDVYVGVGGRAASPSGGAFKVAAGRWQVFPWAVGDVEVDADPAAAIVAPGLLICTLRFTSTQPMATGTL